MTTWIYLKGITSLSETVQAEKDKCSMVSFNMWNLKTDLEKWVEGWGKEGEVGNSQVLIKT